MKENQSQALEIAPEQPKINEAIAIYQGASLLKIEKEEQEKLAASFDAELIEIRPDGLIYLPQVFWRQRLNETFGIGQWCLVVKGSHKDPNPEKDKLYVQGVLMVRGSYVAEAVGEAELHSNNATQSWASVWESAKSDCITRCCKDLGIACELWQPTFIRTWQAQNAIQVWVDGKNKPQWRKRNAPPFYKEKGHVQNSSSSNANTGNDGPVYPKQRNNDQPITDVDQSQQSKPSMAQQGAKPWLNPDTDKWKEAVKYLQQGGNIQSVEAKYRMSKVNREKLLGEAV